MSKRIKQEIERTVGVDVGDRWSQLCVLDQESGEVIGLLVNFACHPVTLDYSNLDFTADYVWALRETVRAVYPSAAAVFLNGVLVGGALPKDKLVQMIDAAKQAPSLATPER